MSAQPSTLLKDDFTKGEFKVVVDDQKFFGPQAVEVHRRSN